MKQWKTHNTPDPKNKILTDSLLHSKRQQFPVSQRISGNYVVKTVTFEANENVTTAIFTAEGWQLSLASDSDLNTQSSFIGIPASATVSIPVTVELPSVHLTDSVEWRCTHSELAVTAYALDCDSATVQGAKCVTTHETLFTASQLI